MKQKNKFLFGAFLLFVILFSGAVFSTYSSSSGYTKFSSSSYSSFMGSSSTKDNCAENTDFILQLDSLGCTPIVVRSDLLEEQNVPVFCPIAALDISPVIDVASIKSVSFSGNYNSSEVSGVGFYPTRASLLGSSDVVSADTGSIGYAVIVLKQHKTEDDMPDSVSGNITATLSYDYQTALGIGASTFYLPVLDDSTFEQTKNKYSFWNGKGYLKLNSLTSDSADVSVLSGDSNVVSTTSLAKGESSSKISLPGFDCLADLTLKLVSLENPDTYARLMVNSELVEVTKGEKFLNNKCTVSSLEKYGLLQRVTVSCVEDSKNTKLVLTINPKIKLDVGGETKDYSVGDKIFDIEGATNEAIYLGYIGSDNSNSGSESFSSVDKKNLVVYFYKGVNQGEKLSEDKIYAVARSSSSMLFSLGNSVKSALTGNKVTDWVAFGSSNTISGKAINIVGFSDAENVVTTSSAFDNYYENAMEDYRTIKENFPTETDANSDKYSEQAMYRAIELAYSTGKKLDMVELCKEFSNSYPKSTMNMNSYCGNDYRIANQDSNSLNVVIGGDTKILSLEQIVEPSFDDYGATIIFNKDGKATEYNFRKNQIIYVEGSDNKEYLQLVSLDENSAKFKLNLNSSEVGKQKISNTFTLNLNSMDSFGSAYSVSLVDVNLEKLAKVSVIPSTNSQGSKASFNFKISISKRSIKLSPETIADKIKGLNETIANWQEKSESLGKVVKGLKTACLAVGTMLTLKNFFANTDGRAIARTNVMKGSGGWYETCESYVAGGKYLSVDECLVAEADNIEGDVEAYYGLLTAQNNEIKQCQEPYTTRASSGARSVDSAQSKVNCFGSNLQSEVSSSLSNNLEKDTIKVGDTNVAVSEITSSDRLSSDAVSLEELRNLQLNSRILASSETSSTLKSIAKNSLNKDLGDIYANTQTLIQEKAAQSQITSNDNLANVGTTYSSQLSKNVYSYTGGMATGQVGEIPKDTAVQSVSTTSGTYLVSLGLVSKSSTNYVIQDVYNTKGEKVDTKLAEEVKKEFSGTFKKYDSSSYNNFIKNPEIKYYETGTNKGLPALVPFDIDNGWYVATKEVVSARSGITAYEDNGRVSTFYLGNVGSNGLIEFFNGGGDDTYQLISTTTSQSYTNFPGLSASQTKTLVDKAVSAIEQASKAYASGVSAVTINGKTYQVGSPATDTSETRCTDFMSPRDCQLLFNVCDPVICPSSRCDLGGTYPVADVIQSGIIGSIVLCLPNFREGIFIPICLSGIKAGIDALISVMESYRDCLQTSLDTGETVGVCDEIYSINLCEFFWRQIFPLMKISLSGILQNMFDQNVHGGGEYLGVQSALTSSQNSVSYLTQSYAANSYKAFQARSSESVGADLCQNFVSLTSVDGSSAIDALTDPDSPPQFYGRFDEIAFTTVTTPPMSQYKVYYHIYAGKDSRAYYKVYMKGTSSSYYQDTASDYVVDSGYIAKGEYESQTKDFTATAGYTDLCIVVNNQEECGFKQSTTDFAVNYITDSYVGSQASNTEITSAEDCVSTSGGVVRVCSTGNPGNSTDAKVGTSEARWIEVGYCDETKLKCWIDTNSVKTAITSTEVEGNSLKTVTDNQLKILMEEGNYLSDNDFTTLVSELESATNEERISKVTAVYDKLLFSSQKAYVLLVRGNAYSNLAKANVIISPSSFGSGASGSETPTETISGTNGEQNLDDLMNEQANEELKREIEMEAEEILVTTNCESLKSSAICLSNTNPKCYYLSGFLFSDCKICPTKGSLGNILDKNECDSIKENCGLEVYYSDSSGLCTEGIKPLRWSDLENAGLAKQEGTIYSLRISTADEWMEVQSGYESLLAGDLNFNIPSILKGKIFSVSVSGTSQKPILSIN